jgi:protein required for attachment to host cells
MVPIDQTVKSAYWVLVADESQARIFSREKKFSDLVEVASFENPVARMKTGDVMSDRGGRSFDSGGQGRHSMDSDKANPKTESYPAFARELAREISKGRRAKKYARLAVAAAPRFLGILRPALESAGVKADVTIDKAIAGQDATAIRKVIDSA